MSRGRHNSQVQLMTGKLSSTYGTVQPESQANNLVAYIQKVIMNTI